MFCLLKEFKLGTRTSELNGCSVSSVNSELEQVESGDVLGAIGIISVVSLFTV